MGQHPGSIRQALARRSTFLSMAAAVVGLWGMPQRTLAGVILPPALQQTPLELTRAADVDLPGDAPCSASAPVEPLSKSGQRENGDGRLSQIIAREGLTDAGGASAPPGSAAGSGVFCAVAVLDGPVVLAPARASHYLRENRVQLPQPPPGELLDPPKAG